MNEMYYNGVLLWKYIDQWPKIPNQITEDAFSQVARQKLQFANITGKRVITQGNKTMLNMQCRRWDTPTQLESWMMSELHPFDITAIQYFINREDRDRLYPHTDSAQRRWVTLYVHETGGEKVETFFYKEHNQPVTRDYRVMVNNLDLLDVIGSVIIEPHRWIIINALVLHDVHPIENVRKSIIGGIAQENLDFLQHGLGPKHINFCKQ